MTGATGSHWPAGHPDLIDRENATGHQTSETAEIMHSSEPGA